MDSAPGVEVSNDENLEQLRIVDIRRMWERAVFDQGKGVCSNCGHADRVRVHMVVPEEVGGRLVPSNGVVLCRACEMARDGVLRQSRGIEQRPINFWVSRQFHDRIWSSLMIRHGEKSLGGLIKYLIGLYVASPEQFDDLDQYQDVGKEVKVNVWVDAKNYEIFKQMLSLRRMTVTDAVKGLLMVYDMDTKDLESKNTDSVSGRGE